MLPEYLIRRKGVVNVPAPNQLSFHFALAASEHSGNRRRGQLEYMNTILRKGWHQINYPIQLIQLIRLTNGTLNTTSTPLVFNVYTIDDAEGKKKRCIYFGNERNDPCIFLLYHEGRFFFIRNFGRFLAGQNDQQHRCFNCERCLLRFNSELKRREHQASCDFQVIFSSLPLDSTTIQDRDHLELPNATSKFNVKLDRGVFQWIRKKHERLAWEETNRVKRLAAKTEEKKQIEPSKLDKLQSNPIDHHEGPCEDAVSRKHADDAVTEVDETDEFVEARDLFAEESDSEEFAEGSAVLVEDDAGVADSGGEQPGSDGQVVDPKVSRGVSMKLSITGNGQIRCSCCSMGEILYI